MPFLDAQNLFSHAEKVTATVGTHNSQNIIDFGAGAGRNLNPRERIFCQVVNTPVGGSDATFTAKLVGANELEGEYKVIASSPAFKASELNAGTLVLEGTPELLKSNYRFVKMQYVIAGSAFSTAPVVTSGIVQDGMWHHELEH